jgi:hypothetical protein
MDRTGTLADVREARRAISAKFEPPFVLYVALAAAFALWNGSKSLLPALVGAAAFSVVPLALAWRNSRRSRFIRPRRIRLFSRRAFVLTIVCCLFLVIVLFPLMYAPMFYRGGSLAAVFSHRGTPLSYVVAFVVFIVPLIAATTVIWRLDPYGIDARPMREVPDQPAVVDPVIESKLPIMVCATLAGVDWLDAGFLAKTLRLTDEGLRQHTAELTAAQYVSVYPEGSRWWLTLTPAGRAAYRRHLRALLQPAVAADGLASR